MKFFIKLQIGFIALLFLILLLFFVGGSFDSSLPNNGKAEPFNGSFTDDLPAFPEIKGKGQISDEIAQLAVSVAVKYQLLPSVILSQYAYESAWGQSHSAINDTNFFGITWFNGCPFPQGSPRGAGGSEGGHYMKFPNPETSFNYYGFMVASQPNFNASVGLKSPSDSLLVLGRGGYAAADITESSQYYSTAMKFIQDNQWQEYDDFVIDKWNSVSTANNEGGNADIVKVAQEELKKGTQAGGMEYWSWYGFNGRVEWCAAFVSYAADKAGLIADGKAPKHASCLAGVNWFKERGRYREATSNYIPQSGDIIYFDWTGGRTGSMHVGIVESCNGSSISTIEGNSGDQLNKQSYSLNDVVISGYGEVN